MSTRSGPMVVRTWNLFHGNTVPPQRRAFLRDMVELVTADRPWIVCLQEVPVWALRLLGRWSGMTAVGVVAARPRLRSAAVGRRVTDVHHGVIRSAVTGQANAILVAGPVADERSLVVSTSGERRVCQSLRVDDVVVGNFHVTAGASAEPQLQRAVEFVETQAERVILAGDANVLPGESSVYESLLERGFSRPLPESIDQILVRGLSASAPVAWPEERRRVGGRVLSDHAPVELTLR